MTCDYQLGIQAAGVVGTLIIATVAIWGEPIRAYFVGPRLILRLLSADGERQQINTGGYARFYHLHVTNTRRRFAPAKNVRVVLTGIARPDANGELRWHWLSGPIQLMWQHGHSVPQFLTIGAPQNADLGNLLQQGMFSLALLFTPIGLNVSLEAGERMMIEAKAQSDQTESAPVRVQIAWDGQWSDDTAEMAKHLVVGDPVAK